MGRNIYGRKNFEKLKLKILVLAEIKRKHEGTKLTNEHLLNFVEIVKNESARETVAWLIHDELKEMVDNLYTREGLR